MIEEDKACYGEILRKVRISRGFQSAYVADKLDMAPESFALLERGKRKLSVERFIKLLDLYKMSLSEFKRVER